jgi:hypothetical protein
MPMLGFLFETPVCLLDEFREGNESPRDGHVAFYRGCRERIPEGKRIARYRADSASYQADLINELEKDDVLWAITARQDCAVRSSIEAIEEEKWEVPVVGCGYQIAETVHTMNKTDKGFRLIVRRWGLQGDLFDPPGQKYGYHVVASNCGEEEKGMAVLKWHNGRGQAENFNKELKSGFGCEQMPCGQMSANAVFFRIGVIAYNLFMGFKLMTCPQGLRQRTIAMFRWKLINVAGRIVYHARRAVLRLVVDAQTLLDFKRIRRKCFALAMRT